MNLLGGFLEGDDDDKNQDYYPYEYFPGGDDDDNDEPDLLTSSITAEMNITACVK